MTRDNLIQLEAYRRQQVADQLRSQGEHRPLDRSKESLDSLLAKLRRKKRLTRGDQIELVANLGRLIERLDEERPRALAKTLLGDELWAKRKRYIRFPNEPIDARTAASGGTFARIIESLIGEKTRRGFDPAQARIATVQEALNGTSFRPSSQSTITTDGKDAASLVRQMESVLNSLARQAQLEEYFELIAKYSVWPSDEWSASDPRNFLKFDPKAAPNSLSSWNDTMEDGELQYWVPWWAPKCVIGHLYIPILTECFFYPEQEVLRIKEACDGTITQDRWIQEEYSYYIESLITSEQIRPRLVHHRLPIWLVVLPIERRLVACLFTSIHYNDDLQIKFSVSDESYFSYINSVTPCFVDTVGTRLDNDVVYFCHDPYETHIPFHVCVSDDQIKVIGSGLDRGISNFQAEFFDRWLMEDELPPWLHPYQVQNLLKFAADERPAKAMALEPREFTNFDNRYSTRDFDTKFRPAFPDPIEMPAPFINNSIAGYLMRNFTYSQNAGIFDALKRDAIAKAGATKKTVQDELSKFQRAFRDRFGD